MIVSSGVVTPIWRGRIVPPHFWRRTTGPIPLQIVENRTPYSRKFTQADCAFGNYLVWFFGRYFARCWGATLLKAPRAIVYGLAFTGVGVR